MRALILLIAAFGTVEGLAYWWMHPAPAGVGEPVLAWRPSEPAAIAPGLGAAPPRVTPLPEVVEESIPILHCTAGQARMLETADGVTVFMAVFEWDAADGNASVLEAFKHPPEACLGYLGLQPTGTGPVRVHRLDGQSIAFACTTLRDPTGAPLHAFKGVWVSGTAALPAADPAAAGPDFERLIRWQAAARRFRPAHARAVQGMVRGAANPDDAWLIFQTALLNDLRLEP